MSPAIWRCPACRSQAAWDGPNAPLCGECGREVRMERLHATPHPDAEELAWSAAKLLGAVPTGAETPAGGVEAAWALERGEEAEAPEPPPVALKALEKAARLIDPDPAVWAEFVPETSPVEWLRVMQRRGAARRKAEAVAAVFAADAPDPREAERLATQARALEGEAARLERAIRVLEVNLVSQVSAAKALHAFAVATLKGEKPVGRNANEIVRNAAASERNAQPPVSLAEAGDAGA